MNTIAGQITPLGYQITRALLDARISVFFVSHRFGFADRSRREDAAGTLFLRAERGPGGRRNYQLTAKDPLPPATEKTSTTGPAAG